MKKTRCLSFIFILILVLCLTGCRSEVENKTITIEYNGKTYEGNYTGVLVDGIPEETGNFLSGDLDGEDYLAYDGEWEAGSFKGKGTLTTDNYVVHFPKTDQDDALDRTGAFDGEVLDGVASGQGSFKAINDFDQEYIYSGEWKNGLWNGYGIREYVKNEHYSEVGNFIDCEYLPSIADLVVSLGTLKINCPYSISEEAYNYIKDNEKVFLNHKKSDVKKLSPKDFEISTFKKNPQNYKPGLVEIPWLYVIQAFESDFGGYDITYELAVDQNDNYYSLYFVGKSSDVVEGAELRAIFMPLGYSTYETVNGGNQWAVSGIIAY